MQRIYHSNEKYFQLAVGILLFCCKILMQLDCRAVICLCYNLEKIHKTTKLLVVFWKMYFKNKDTRD